MKHSKDLLCVIPAFTVVLSLLASCALLYPPVFYDKIVNAGNNPGSGSQSSQGGGSIPIPRNGLVGEWLFNGNVGDTSGSGNNGTAQNGQFFTVDRFGNPGNAFLCAGTNYVDASTDITDINPQGSFTYNLWVRIDQITNQVFILDRVPFSMSLVDFLADSSNNSYIFEFRYEDGSGLTNIYAGNISIGKYQMLTIVRDYGNAFNLFVDNNLAGSFSDNGLSLVAYKPRFGNYQNGGVQLQGAIDDVRIYNRALSSAEISALYNEGE